MVGPPLPPTHTVVVVVAWHTSHLIEYRCVAVFCARHDVTMTHPRDQISRITDRWLKNKRARFATSVIDIIHLCIYTACCVCVAMILIDENYMKKINVPHGRGRLLRTAGGVEFRKITARGDVIEKNNYLS